MKKIIMVFLCVMLFSFNVSALGYGQGKQKDNENRPIGALDFNSQYSKYDSYAINENDDRIILTFDQGYENGYTTQILDTLKEKNVKAIFFLTGDYAKKETDLVERMIAEGHIIGNHGMEHNSLATCNVEKEIMPLHNFISEKYGIEMNFLRPPCGEYSEDSLKQTSELGYTTLFWSFAHVDWLVDKQPDPRKALANLIENLHQGEILLLHSVSKTNTEILPEFIDTARAKGFNF
jgi:peptidoglycan-N-acetylmuramic acid deacetylase